MALVEPPHADSGHQVIDENARLVLDAVADEEYDFRTVDGVADATGLAPSLVQEILDDHEDLVRLSPVPGPNREALYTLRSRPMTRREQLALAQSVVASPVG
jgi:hypothetical protein